MRDLSITELRRLDLTLLLVFLGLLRHRKAAAVAAELGVTPSAVSQALKRLREIFGDPLFLRRPHGLAPTATALALEAPVADAVEALRGALGLARRFDPATAAGVVTVAALHAEQAVLMPPLAATLRSAAPGLAVSVIPHGPNAAIAALQEGVVDLAVGSFGETPEAIGREILYSDGYVVVGRPEAFDGSAAIALDAYCAAEHILTTPRGDLTGVVDARLSALGRRRRVVMGLPAFLPALAAVAASGALATTPSRVAAAFAPRFGLVAAAPPLDLPRFDVSVLWHRRNDADPRTTWLRAQLLAGDPID